MNPVEQRIMEVLKPKIAEEAVRMKETFPEKLRSALESLGVTRAVVSAGTIIIDAAASLSKVESVVGQLRGMWPAVTGSAAAGSGSLSTTDTVSNIPPQAPPKAPVSEGHASHNKQPPQQARPTPPTIPQKARPPPPPTPKVMTEPVQQAMRDGASGNSSPRDPETEDESDGSSEMILDENRETLVKYNILPVLVMPHNFARITKKM